MDKMRLADGREISEHYTPGMAKSWLTAKVGPNGVETFEPYNNMNPVRLAESFVIYADRTLARIKKLEAEVRALKQQADENWRAAVGAENDAQWERGVW